MVVLAGMWDTECIHSIVAHRQFWILCGLIYENHANKCYAVLSMSYAIYVNWLNAIQNLLGSMRIEYVNQYCPGFAYAIYEIFETHNHSSLSYFKLHKIPQFT